MLRSLFDAVMERRAGQLVAIVRDWLPSEGTVLDLGSGTGHTAVFLETELGLRVTPADVSDLHVVGRAPVLIGDGRLPFEDDSFSAALLLFMLAYPEDPVPVLREAARVTRGPVIVIQTLSSGILGRSWHRARELTWTFAAFHLAKAIGYVGRGARFTMHTRRYYAPRDLESDVTSAGLRVIATRKRAVLPFDRVVVVAWRLER